MSAAAGAGRVRGPRPRHHPGRGGPVRGDLLAVAHQAFAAAADPVLDEPLAPVAHLGIDEHRRGRSGDPEYGIKNLLARNLEHLTAQQFARIIETLDASAAGQQAAAAWIAKEKLRDALNLRARVTGSTPCERNVRGRLFSFYLWRAGHDDIPELISLAKTISRWEGQIVWAVITGVTNPLPRA
jgi:hypothetical protein